METTVADKNILALTEQYVKRFFDDNISPDYVFHNFPHTEAVVESAREIGQGCKLPERELTLVQLAAWFHDLGYDKGPANHEERSIQYARDFLSKNGVPEADLQVIDQCIRATKVPHHPDQLLEEILCDADMSHLGKESYWDRCGRIRQELLVTQQMIMSEQEWIDFEINFMLQHRYHTEVATGLYDLQKQKHIRQLYKQKARLYPEEPMLVEIPPKPEKKKKKNGKNLIKLEKDEEWINLGRGVETMYRTTYRTHITLSAIADNKANIMMSINAIVISIILTNLVPKFAEMPKLAAPTIFLLVVCLVAMVFATLSTRPKVTTGTFTREDIEQRRTNLLFFGNYFNMSLVDFQWGMKEMIKDSDFLYSSMTRDLYYLGKVLAQKYRYLRICYTVFMYGLIASVAFFAIYFLI